MTQRTTRALLVLGGIGLAAGGVACPDRDLGQVEPMVVTGTRFQLVQPGSDAVDLLVMVDNSSSMAQEQSNLTQNFQILLDELTAPRDTDGDQAPARPLVSDLHVGVISSDMGTGGYAVQTCRDAIDGDDGILRDTAERCGRGLRRRLPAASCRSRRAATLSR